MDKKVYLVLIILFIADCISFAFVSELRKDDLLKVVFFDVGQGDGVFIETPQGHQVVIDGGPDYERISLLIEREVPFWDKEIDAIIMTHSDKDHMNGLLGVMERYRVDNVIWNGIDGDGVDKWKSLLSEEVTEGALVHVVVSGDRIESGGVVFDFIWPDQDASTSEDINANSIVTRMCYEKNCFLFTGDISSEEEDGLITKGISSDILKVAHHGSKYSSSKSFLDTVDPRLAIIQVGKNNYGHPDKGVLDRFTDEGIRIMRTDASGNIEIYSDGKDYKVITER